jgi:pyruvate/2-oxoglutarate dehydrogenase complex dihydrolipoamide acyltransferase (E2) component
MTIEDMAGGTFTISNGGIYGSLMGERQTIRRILIF